jgi:hypothetical protein
MLSALRGNKCLSAEAAEEFAEFARSSAGYRPNCRQVCCFDGARMVVSNRAVSRS